MKKGYIKCPFCANEIKEGAIKCQYCGEFFDNEEHNKTSRDLNDSNSGNNKRNRNFLWILIIIILVLIVIYLIFFKQKENINVNNVDVLNETTNSNEIQDNNLLRGNSIDDLLENFESRDNISEELNNKKAFDTSTDVSSWQTYDDGNISFKYPSYMVVGNKKFKDFTFFNDSTNIYVNSYDFKSLFDPIIQTKWDIEEEFCDYEDQIRGTCHSMPYDKFIANEKNHFQQIIQNINDGKTITRQEFFDQYSNFGTKGPFIFKNVTVNGNKGLLIYYYFTQDEGMGCLTQFNTEILLLKNDKIYSIMFKNNFGGVYKLMKQYDNSYGEACLYDSLKSKAESISNQLEDFYENGTTLRGTDYIVFAENDEIIKSIINTIMIK